MGGQNIFGDVLLVEGNPGDVRLVREIFEDGGLNPNFHVVDDGKEALEFLHRQGDFADAPFPDLLLLSWHSTRNDGVDLLSEVDGDEKFGEIPVIVQAGSEAQIDVIKGNGGRADGYLTKPVRPEEFLAVLDRF